MTNYERLLDLPFSEILNELGAAFPRIDKLKKLAELFGCSVSELLEGWKEE